MVKNDILNNLEILKINGLVDSAFENIKKWLTEPEYADFFNEIEKLINDENISELNDAFYKVMPFGTGGRRGKMGAGSNRMNTRTIAESSQGFSDYLIETFGSEDVKKRGVVITYDIRNNSELFAKYAAEIFAANGLTVYFFKGIRSTPQLSFTIRYKKAAGGVMISASHNPPEDNGIKVYWENGGQVVPPHDVNIIQKVMRVTEVKKCDFDQAIKDGKIILLDDVTDRAYAETVGSLSLGNYRDVDIVFTPLHGCASTSFLPVLKHVGFTKIHEVEEQMSFDPNFSNVAKRIPNPEVPISLDLATAQAKKIKADLVVAADPDADRIGVVSRRSYTGDEYVFLNGNQIAALLFDYITKELKKQGKLDNNYVLIKTAVTTDLLTKIAQDNGVEVIGDLPVGCKYIADAIDNIPPEKKFLFGGEESHGYLYGDYARDKDGAASSLLICEYAALLKQQGRTLFEQLEEIKKEYGYYRELVQSIFYRGMDGMDKMSLIMKKLREKLPVEINGLKVESVFDQLNKKTLDPRTGEVVGEYSGFPDNALVFWLNPEKMIRVVARPSGTEPKIKFYAAVGLPTGQVGLPISQEKYEQIKKEGDKLAHAILEDLVKIAEQISPGGERYEILG
ncbi:MAG: phospho-sugar mutase [Candidatus Magasanikbacteria bacterium CG10_big_fil_rev_8_21_14_0_10_36_32]|uniref:Phospho-sugar mutase n=1 Tax=Candidatus Magasanikbacteria bacterium CG10_big_fil_rev_8_21_14_0_10_36_32 TaxID=1974646 RepID=A0A2M6W6L2_9BACT|nr:MAG: phospho-sugar mutase [Candidatus Magasanikbacteria bacterium CG10_big_fil_rev_8_21_14_0_10_36_32]